jgi:hypothetical protein
VTGRIENVVVGWIERVEDLLDDLQLLCEDVLVTSPGSSEVLRHALDDAIFYRDPPQECRACEAAANLCSQCAETLAISLTYLRTAKELGLDSDRR